MDEFVLFKVTYLLLMVKEKLHPFGRGKCFPLDISEHLLTDKCI